MYANVKSCVKSCNSIAVIFFFEYSVGLRQGEVLLPIQVSLFSEDLELLLQNDADSGLLIEDIVVMFLFLLMTWQFLASHKTNCKIN